MKKYIATFISTETGLFYRVEIEAENEDSAYDKLWDSYPYAGSITVTEV